MPLDVVDLRNFYGQALGTVARRFVGRGIRARWQDLHGLRVLGIGYPTPYLGLFREEAERCLAFMPAAQGVVEWPSDRPALATLVDEDELPLAAPSARRRCGLCRRPRPRAAPAAPSRDPRAARRPRRRARGRTDAPAPAVLRVGVGLKLPHPSWPGLSRPSARSTYEAHRGY